MEIRIGASLVLRKGSNATKNVRNTRNLVKQRERTSSQSGQQLTVGENSLLEILNLK